MPRDHFHLGKRKRAAFALLPRMDQGRKRRWLSKTVTQRRRCGPRCSSSSVTLVHSGEAYRARGELRWENVHLFGDCVRWRGVARCYGRLCLAFHPRSTNRDEAAATAATRPSSKQQHRQTPKTYHHHHYQWTHGMLGKSEMKISKHVPHSRDALLILLLPPFSCFLSFWLFSLGCFYVISCSSSYF